MKVQLRYATLPSPLGLFAAHYWFVVWDADGSHRREVWQTKNPGGWSIGHVHCDLQPPDAGVGGGPARIAAEWTGAGAAAIKAVLENVTGYPHRERYLAWPGPNSNTFASWVLRRAGIRHRLGWMALGQRYRCRTPASTGEHFVGIPARNRGHSRTSPIGRACVKTRALRESPRGRPLRSLCIRRSPPREG